MAAIYEVWEKSKYDRGNNKPEATFFVIDSAFDEVKRLSKGKTHTSKTWVSKPNSTNPWHGEYAETELADVYIVVEKNKLTTLRGYGISGKLLTPKDCKRCSNTGNDANNWGLPCAACSGACQMKL